MKRVLSDIAYAILGSFLVAAGLTMFTIPNDIAPGGVSGLATALAHITPIRISVWNLLLNIPLMLAAWRNLGRRSVLFTLLSTVMLSLFLDITAVLLPAYTGNALTAGIYGGVTSGLGIGLLFLRGISTGGTDLLALILKKPFPNIASGTMLLMIDAAVVVIAMIIFSDIEVALNSAVSLYVTSKVIDSIAAGFDYAKVIYIVSEKGEAISAQLNAVTDRGTTLVPATGGYTGRGKHLVITVTKRNVLSQTLQLIKRIDPNAFMFVVNSTEVHGEGFKVENVLNYRSIPTPDSSTSPCCCPV